MKLFRRKRGIDRQLTRRDALDGVPVKNPLAQATRQEDGGLLLVYPMALPHWVAAAARALGHRRQNAVSKKLQLDQLGAATWHLVDGRSSVRDIVARFAETYQLDNRESEIAVSQFLRELGKRGLIAIH
jgi:hypothetical protein